MVPCTPKPSSFALRGSSESRAIRVAGDRPLLQSWRQRIYPSVGSVPDRVPRILTLTRELLILWLPGLLWGANTTVTRTVVDRDGALATGTAYIRISAPFVSGSSYVTAQTRAVRFTAGNFSVSLVPNDTCVPAGTSYTVGWAMGESTAVETWFVPTSATSVTVGSVIL